MSETRGLPEKPRLPGNRKHPRFRVQLEVRYRFEGEERANFSENASLGGIFIHTRKPLPPGTPVILSLTLPENEQTLRLDGEVVWARCTEPPGAESERSGMGVEFQNLASLEERTLEALLNAMPREEG